MTQGLLEVFGFYLQSQVSLPQTYRPLRQQSHINRQVHETSGKLIARNQSSSKVFAI